jgi:hypothetical protein
VAEPLRTGDRRAGQSQAAVTVRCGWSRVPGAGKPHARPGFAVPVQQVAGQGPIALGGDLRPSIAECYADDADPVDESGGRPRLCGGGSALADWTAPHPEGAAPSAPVIHETAGHSPERITEP